MGIGGLVDFCGVLTFQGLHKQSISKLVHQAFILEFLEK